MASFLPSTKTGVGAWTLAGAPIGLECPTGGDRTLGAGPDRGARRGASLAKMVESEIIPRLMLAHRSLRAEAKAASPPAPAGSSLGEGLTETFARMVVSKEPDSLLEFVGGLLGDGIAIEAILVDLLAPAARRLGEYWDEDSISFADVTIGLGRLQQVVRALGLNIQDGDVDKTSPSALFALAPGEQHSFGLFIIEDSFRRAGWRTWVETSAKRQDLVDAARAHWFDMFGLSASRDAKPGDIAELISIIKFSSRNRDLFILVGGRLFIEHPELVAEVGADSTAASGQGALLIVNEALSDTDNGVRRVASGL